MSQTFTLTITMGNAAMRTREDVADALERTARMIRAGHTLRPIMDENGNTVGSWEAADGFATEDDDEESACTVDCAEYGCAGPGGWTHATKEGDAR